jgi:serine/threonine protein kinase
VSSPSHSSTRHDIEGAVDTPRTFSSLALELNFLNVDQLSEVTRASGEQQISLEQTAQNMGLMNATQLVIIETLLNPHDAAPGYEALGLLGRGGMGVVYRARQKSLNRIVALKTVSVSDLADATALQRFEQEAVTLARLTHPHIVAAYDFGKHRGRLYFAMELIVGEDCDRFVRRNGPLVPMLAWGIIRQAAAGLAHAAAAGIVHRDIKPANLLLLEPPVGFPLPKGIPLVKIADFGLAHLMADSDVEGRTRLTKNNTTLGSPYYMAPEQLDGIEVDQRADIYALGISAWHLLAGHPPLAGKPLSQLMASKLAGEIPSVSTVRDDIAQDAVNLIATMVRRQPDERIRDYAELLRRIDALDLTQQSISLTVEVERPQDNIHGVDTVQFSRPETGSVSQDNVPTAPSPITLRPRRWSRRRVLQLAGALVGVLVLTIVALKIHNAWNSPGPRSLVPSHKSTFLFDGENMSSWRTIYGSWNIGEDDENAAVLIGDRGSVARPLPTTAGKSSAERLDFYRLEIAVRLHQADAVELHFDLAAAPKTVRSVLRMTVEGSQLGYRRGERGPFIAKTVRREHVKEPDEMHSITLERQLRGWWVFVDGQFVGALRARTTKPASEFRLTVEKGPAWFSDISVEQLVKPKT